MSTEQSETAQLPTVLLVDDEVNVLSGYRRALRKSFDIQTAASGAEALEFLKSNGEIPVIIVDMRMPEMSGLELLMQVKLRYPDMVRIMLTGNADQQTAIDAINRGEIFRFVNKPCSPEQLTTIINQGLENFRLHKLEQDMLRDTVRGAIKSLTEVLSLINPEAFGRTVRISDLTVTLAKSVGIRDVWFFESLAMLSQLGSVILPDEVLELVYQGGDLTEEQQQLVQLHPGMGAGIVEKIPRMENLSRGILYQMKNYDGSGVPDDDVAGEKIPLGGRILRVVTDFDRYVTSGLTEKEAYERLSSHHGRYDPGIMKTLKKVLASRANIVVQKLTIGQLLPGMVIVADVTTNAGILVIPKGHVVSEALIQRLKLFSRQQVIAEPIHVIMKPEEH